MKSGWSRCRAPARDINSPETAAHTRSGLPDGRSLYFDRDHQMFQLAVNVSDPSSIGEPVALPIKGFVQAEYRRQFDLMPNGRQFLMLFPVSPQ